VRRGRTIGIAVALLALLGAVGSAHAATATVSDPPGDGATADVVGAAVSWDGATLTVSVTFASPAMTSLEVVLSESASRRADGRCAEDVADVLTVDADATTAHLLGTDLDADPAATAVWAGDTVTYAFSDPGLPAELRRRDPFACASGSADGDRFAGAFDGKVLKITPRGAVDALGSALAARFGTSFKRARKPWLACPRRQIKGETAALYATVLCRFEFRAGARVHGGSVQLMLISGVLKPERLRSSTYTKRMRACRIASSRGGLAHRLVLTGRTLRAARSLGGCRQAAGHAADFERTLVRRYPKAMPARFAVRDGGRGTAGFDARYRFACRAPRHGSRYVVTCVNHLGDRFVHTVTVTQKPKPKPPSPPPPPSSGGGGGSGCDPNYAGACLDPNASDYDCAGGSGNGPLYVQGPITVVGNDHYGLDSDGDGIACES